MDERKNRWVPALVFTTGCRDYNYMNPFALIIKRFQCMGQPALRPGKSVGADLASRFRRFRHRQETVEHFSDFFFFSPACNTVIDVIITLLGPRSCAIFIYRMFFN